MRKTTLLDALLCRTGWNSLRTWGVAGGRWGVLILVGLLVLVCPDSASAAEYFCYHDPAGSALNVKSNVFELPDEAAAELDAFNKIKGFEYPSSLPMNSARKITEAWHEALANDGVSPGRRSFCRIRYNQNGVDAYVQGEESNPVRVLDWSPNLGGSDGGNSKRLVYSVPFDDPNTSLGENGFAGVVFDVEYQFIACSGELHIAYSLVEDSVGIGRLAGGGNRVLTNGGRGRANYWLDGKVYKVGALPEKVVNLPLKGTVWVGHQDQPLGRFADDHAGKALGFGCFSGQTKKIANLKDLNNGESPTKDELPKILEKLRVNFATNEILTSSAAEEEIRNGLASKGDTSKPKRAGSDQDIGPSAADLAAEARAKREADFQAKQAQYERDLAAQRQAVADYEEAKRKMAEQARVSGAQAQAVQEEFARQQAQHQAELEAFRKAQAEYEAKLKAMNSPQQ